MIWKWRIISSLDYPEQHLMEWREGPHGECFWYKEAVNHGDGWIRDGQAEIIWMDRADDRLITEEEALMILYGAHDNRPRLANV